MLPISIQRRDTFELADVLPLCCQAFWKGALDVTAGLTAGLRHNLTACTADPANGVEAHGKDWRAREFSDTRQWEQCGWR